MTFLHIQLDSKLLKLPRRGISQIVLSAAAGYVGSRRITAVQDIDPRELVAQVLPYVFRLLKSIR
jgi:hypothetical protein